jgi:formate dehydrogenase assembly factor FdhD
MARIIAAVKNIDAPMLTRVWQELEYRTDVCRVTRGTHSTSLVVKKKTFSVFLWL